MRRTQHIWSNLSELVRWWSRVDANSDDEQQRHQRTKLELRSCRVLQHWQQVAPILVREREAHGGYVDQDCHDADDDVSRAGHAHEYPGDACGVEPRRVLAIHSRRQRLLARGTIALHIAQIVRLE
jgi:hypothetical protein